MKKQWIWPLAIGVALGCSLTWWFLSTSTEPSAQESDLGPRPTTQDVDPRTTVPAIEAPTQTKPKPPAEPKPKPTISNDAAPQATQPIIEHTPLVPEYGTLIARNNAIAKFPMRDAAGLPLIGLGFKDPILRVWRREGDIWLQAPGHFDFKEGVLLAGQGHNGGLEPGDHEVEVSLGSYGMASAKFRVGLDEPIESPTLKLKGRRRWITLRFTDREGNPIPYITHLPQFICAPTNAIPQRESQLPAFLREPPNREEQEAFDDDGSHSFRSRRAERPLRIPTNNGSVRVQVIAGVKGTLKVQFDRKLFRNSDFKIRSRFEGPEWDQYSIPLEPRPEYAERIQMRTELEASSSQQRQQTPFDPFDPTTVAKNKTRLIVTAPESSRIEPLYEQHPWSPFEEVEHPAGPTWYRHFTRGYPITVTPSDRAFFRPAPQTIKHKPGSVAHVSLSADPIPCRIEAFFTPTLSEWAREVSFALRGTDELGIRLPKGAHKTTRAADWKHGRFYYETSLSADWAAKLSRPTNLFIGLSRHGGTGIRYLEDRVDWKHLHLRGVKIALNEDERTALKGGSLSIDFRQQLKTQLENPWLVLRLVGDRGEGLPWVHGSVFLADEDPLAQTCRTALLEMDRKQQPFKLGSAHKSFSAPLGQVYEVMEEVGPWTVFPSSRVDPREADGFEDVDEQSLFIDNALAPVPERKVLESYMNPELLDQLKPQAIARLWNQGTWYDTRQKVASDRDGYVMNTQLKLIPGKLYVLYLWSKSRNDLKPDARYVFKARAGITDLGILRLPSY